MKQSLVVAVIASLFGFASLQADAPSQLTPHDAFDKMKALVGSWEATEPTGIQHAEFQIIANGSVIMSRLSGGMPHDMHTMFHMDITKLMLTHYCAMRNQPRMVFVASGDPNRLVFEFTDGTNIKEGDVYMNRVALILEGPDRHVEEWTHIADGEEKTTRLNFRRKQ